jgi:hypothetical protein
MFLHTNHLEWSETIQCVQIIDICMLYLKGYLFDFRSYLIKIIRLIRILENQTKQKKFLLQKVTFK